MDHFSRWSHRRSRPVRPKGRTGRIAGHAPAGWSYARSALGSERSCFRCCWLNRLDREHRRMCRRRWPAACSSAACHPTVSGRSRTRRPALAPIGRLAWASRVWTWHRWQSVGDRVSNSKWRHSKGLALADSGSNDVRRPAKWKMENVQFQFQFDWTC